MKWNLNNSRTRSLKFISSQELQFKLQSKAKLFVAHDGADLNCHNLLAAASLHGLVFSGSTAADLRVIQLGILESEESKQGTPVPTRVVPLPSKAFQIAVNCDHSLLAVDVTKNGICFIQVYSVPSFYANVSDVFLFVMHV